MLAAILATSVISWWKKHPMMNYGSYLLSLDYTNHNGELFSEITTFQKQEATAFFRLDYYYEKYVGVSPIQTK